MIKNKLILDYVLPKLKRLFERSESVETAILFGSIAKNKFSVHDIDIALKLNKEDLLETGYIITQIAKTLHINEDHIDMVLLNQTNPIMLSKILKEGIIIKAQPKITEQLSQKAERKPDALIEIKLLITFDPKLNKTVISSRIEESRRNTQFIRNEILSKKIEDLDYKDMLALEKAMHRIIEAMLDIHRHLVAAYSLGFVER
jgi:predicted nucleotidyltransferase